MSDKIIDINNTMSVFRENLVVGNHDTITLFGIQTQNNLKTYSKRIARLLIEENNELDIKISEVLDMINSFENKFKESKGAFLRKNRYYKQVVKDYEQIYNYIEIMTVYFRLEQTQLIKEIKLLEKLSEMVGKCSKELKDYINSGKKVLNERRLDKYGSESESLFDEQSDDLLWYVRLEKRIDDLILSHSISTQNQAQIKLLHDNNLILLDRISSTISNTFPIWQNQMAIALGIQNLENRLELQEKVFDSANKHTVRFSDVLLKRYNSNQTNLPNIEKVSELNQILQESLREVEILDKNDINIRDGFLI